jgi:putative FmdB family regulatory protein
MPIYEYHCQACGHDFEALQKASDAPLIVCPECSRETLTKGVSAPAFHLRGKGWRSPSAQDKAAAAAAQKSRRVGHMLDSGQAHSHDDDAPQKSSGGHSHSHGGTTHSHAPGHKHDHKH